MTAFPCMTIFFLESSTLAHIVFSEFFKPHDYSEWPAPPCKIYYPLDPLYDADCPEVTAYVCGTNGLTYKNECFLCVDQWEFGPHIKFEKYGKCD
ncbi:serine protease inhibitor Kazal-type 13 [Bos indicus]|uniref:Serine peptidase inhibitor Kazal type 13 n=5 Tax=Bos TaxID=9903 RepID=A0AAA9T1H9_BOVIN|nr:serine protease inhibitor Kazal-type 13 [Bos taurus]XP_019819226.1 PREDICTED: serine protease inhibitor Kazal-type 13 [Bos indicus]XP_027401841.1 serine protease inhibitor Kazal-type 13-like [Bos indicus x Bos taurus]XP_061279919.1 serine protease inhibitor Kazal-type 13-like [Bos javanicus]